MLLEEASCVAGVLCARPSAATVAPVGTAVSSRRGPAAWGEHGPPESIRRSALCQRRRGRVPGNAGRLGRQAEDADAPVWT